MKPVLIMIHGFGKKRTSDFNQYIEWSKNGKYEIVTFDMYDPNNKEIRWNSWVDTAKTKVMEYIDEGRKVSVLGFSMGGVIASYLASILPIEKLILIAPAFDYIGIETASRMMKKYADILVRSESEFKQYMEERLLDDKQFFFSFVELVHELRNKIKDIPCPTLILISNRDEFVPIRSCRYIYKKIVNSRKQLIIFDEGAHEILDHPQIAWDAFCMIRLFLEDVMVR